jgi:hypothetical protein
LPGFATWPCSRRWWCCLIGSSSALFLKFGNINTILTSSAALALVVLAESLVIITAS